MPDEGYGEKGGWRHPSGYVSWQFCASHLSCFHILPLCHGSLRDSLALGGLSVPPVFFLQNHPACLSFHELPPAQFHPYLSWHSSSLLRTRRYGPALEPNLGSVTSWFASYHAGPSGSFCFCICVAVLLYPPYSESSARMSALLKRQ